MEFTASIHDRTEPDFPVKITAVRDPMRYEIHEPRQGSPHAAGYDLFAAEALDLLPGEIVKIPLGFATEMHPDIHCRIESRSGLALRGLVVLTGVIDADYRGEWNVIMMNVGKEPHRVAKGDRVAQGVFRPTVRVAFQEVSELSDTSRGVSGFGSTGR